MDIPKTNKFADLAIDQDAKPPAAETENTPPPATDDESQQEQTEEFDDDLIFEKPAERIPCNWELSPSDVKGEIKGRNSVTGADFEGSHAFFNHLLGKGR
jgi:hypothetical protein